MRISSRLSVNAGSTADAPPAPDGPLVQRARDGDGPAFRALYEQYAPMVHAVLLARAPRQDADDLMQDVFLAAWRALHQLRSGEHAGAWLAAIARHACSRAHRRAGRRPASLDAPPVLDAPVPDEPVPDEPVAEPSDPRAVADHSEELLAVLRGLPEAYRETLAMRLVEGLTGPEIARATGLTHGSVRVNLVRGMKLLKAALHAKGWP
jgi:RNA polymerase sigma-70 factor, ECF subfamily